jgi:UMF1 family MFS transporter
MTEAPYDAALAAAPPAPSDTPDERRRRRAWTVFAAGLESFNVPIVYVLFAPYLTSRVAASAVEGQKLWALTLAVSGFVAAALAPPMAFLAENPARRRTFMIACVALNAIPACVFWLAAPGSPFAVIMLVLVAYGIAAAANDLLYVLYGSMLPEVAPPSIIGRTSGVATALGWVFSLAATGVFLAMFVLPKTPLFGLDPEAGEPARLSGPFAAVMMVAFCAPLLLVRAPAPATRDTRSLKTWFKEELASLMAERAAAIAVAARLVYWSGVVLVMTFGNVVATAILHWPELGSSVFGLLVLVFGALGAWGGGFLDDRLGTRNALCVTLVGLAISLSLILTIAPDRILGVIPATPRGPDDPLFSSLAEQAALALGALTGFFLGTTGPMSRSLVARYAPPGRTARYYGFAALAGNATNVFGPLFVYLVTTMTGSQRAGLLVAPAFLLLGVAVLLRLPRHGYRTVDVEG